MLEAIKAWDEFRRNQQKYNIEWRIVISDANVGPWVTYKGPFPTVSDAYASLNASASDALHIASMEDRGFSGTDSIRTKPEYAGATIFETSDGSTQYRIVEA